MWKEYFDIIWKCQTHHHSVVSRQREETPKKQSSHKSINWNLGTAGAPNFTPSFTQLSLVGLQLKIAMQLKQHFSIHHIDLDNKVSPCKYPHFTRFQACQSWWTGRLSVSAPVNPLWTQDTEDFWPAWCTKPPLWPVYCFSDWGHRFIRTTAAVVQTERRAVPPPRWTMSWKLHLT